MDGLMSKLKNLDVEKYKDVVGKVKNAVMNYTEMEVKVRDATNNDPWGASSTLMNEIADATHNYQHFSVIMDTIYKKLLMTGSNWRQCYKALQLIEHLIKNGAESVIDSAREHIYDIKALMKFTYVDEKSKDQGINVRNRAKEIVELLSDTNRIQDERRKAKDNRNKYGGVSSDQVRSGVAFSGFGSESVPSTGMQSMYRDQPQTSSNESTSSGKFAIKMSDTSSSNSGSNSNVNSAPVATSTPNVSSTQKEPTKTGSLLDLDIPTQTSGSSAAGANEFAAFAAFPPAPAASTAKSNGKQVAPEQDEFADFADFTGFQAAPPPAASGFAGFTAFEAAPSQPAAAPQQSMDLFGGFTPATQPVMNMGFVPASNLSATPLTPSTNTAQSTTTATTAPPTTHDAIDKLVSLDPASLSGLGNKSTTGPSLNAIASANASTPTAQPHSQQQWGFNGSNSQGLL